MVSSLSLSAKERKLRFKDLNSKGLKHCNFCDKDKPLSEFSKRKKTTDGLQSRCKTCKRIYNAQHRPKRKERDLMLGREWKKNNRDKCNKYTREKAKRDPIQGLCTAIVRHALLCGKIKKEPCKICGELKVHAHHTDYDKPLDVMWVCLTHHNAWHRVFTPEVPDYGRTTG